MDLDDLRAKLLVNKDSTDWDEDEAISAAFKPGPAVMNLALPKSGEKRLRTSEPESPPVRPAKRPKIQEAEVPREPKTPKVQTHQLDEVVLPIRSNTIKESVSSGQSTHGDDDYSFKLDFFAITKPRPSARQDRMSLDFMELHSDEILESTSLNF